MKRILKRLARRFRRDQSGTTAVIYALCVLPILLMVGFAIDASRMASARRQMQSSLDAAVLSGAKDVIGGSFANAGDRDAAAGQSVNLLYAADIATGNVHLGPAAISVEVSAAGQVSASATSRLPLIFGGLFGRPDVDISVESGAEAGDSRRVEIVLALDNTSSMFEAGRFNKMREASKGFVNKMFDQAPGDDLLGVSVVPWAAVVNINSERPDSWSKTKVSGGNPPAYGSARTPNAPFQSRRGFLLEPEAENSYSSAEMARDFAPVEWRGCIRSAPGERRVSSGGSVSGKLTDAPVSGMRWHASWVEPELPAWWVPPPGWRPSTGGGGGGPAPVIPGPQGFLLPGPDSLIQNASLTVASSHRLMCAPSSSQSGQPGLRNVYLNETQPCARNFQDPFNGTARACVSDPNEFAYTNGGGAACAWQTNITPWTSSKPISGPNLNCPTAMLGLSGSRRQVIEKLDHMHPVPGGTQADIGLMWGLRALSPQSAWKDFFGTRNAQAPLAWNDNKVRKVMILLTDGKNEAPFHFEGYYGCNEGDTRGSAGPCWKAPGVQSLDRAALDVLTLNACAAIREDYGVELYTIAVDINDSAATNLLKTCAGSDDRTFNITSSELGQTFDAIAARQLRLTK